MYPLNLTKPATVSDPAGFALANDIDEHRALTALGYSPALVEEADANPSEDDGQGHTVESVRAQLDAAGIAYDKRWGLAKLIALLPA